MGGVDAMDGNIDSLTSTLENDPLLAVGLFIAILVFVGGGWLLVRYFRRSPGERFARLVGKSHSLGVLMHPNPDPDAMSCALAVQEIAESNGTATNLYYPGQIRHHENRAFETVLDVDFERIESESDVEESDVVLVDHNEPRGFPGAESIDPIAVVDHHPGAGTGTEFTDVRTDNGACATILTEYFEELGWEPGDPEVSNGEEYGKNQLSPRTATGLVYGIQSDTNRFTRGCSSAEFQAAEFLFRAIEEDKLDRIANPAMDAESLDVKAKAISERDVRSPFAVSDVGTVSNTDAIPQAADELRRLEGVSAVVVLGDKNDQIQFSGRSNDDRVHMGKVLESVVGDIPTGSAGGHARMGGGQCSVEHMHGLGPGTGLTREELKEQLFAAMNGDR